MRTPLERIRLGGLVLFAIFCLSVLGYRVIGGYGWLDAIWMVTITVSTVGYGESKSSLPTDVQLLTLVVIVTGISAAVYTFGGLFQLMVEGELEHLLGRRRMTKEITALSGHTIICGYGRMGRNLARELSHHRRQLVVIDSSPEAFAEATADGYLCILGDATEESALQNAGLMRAGTLVSTFPNDAESVFITLTTRNLNPKIRIIARAERESTEKKLMQAGADTIVMPTVVGARQMGRMITRPSTAQLIRLVDEGSTADIDLDELRIKPGCPLVGMPIEKTEAHRLHKLLVVAIKTPDGALIFNPKASHVIEAEDELMVLGHRDDITRFRQQYGL
jgi:voltage-gated potassium channel